MRVSFIISTQHYRYTADKIARHLKCDYTYHMTFEDMNKYDPDVVVAGLHYKQLDSDKLISVYTGHGLSWGSGLYSKGNAWYDYVAVMSEFIKGEILRFESPPKKDIWVTGWPTTDNLFTKSVKPPVFDKAKGPVILYAPTSNPSSYPYLTNIHELVPKDATLIRCRGAEKSDEKLPGKKAVWRHAVWRASRRAVGKASGGKNQPIGENTWNTHTQRGAWITPPSIFTRIQTYLIRGGKAATRHAI